MEAKKLLAKWEGCTCIQSKITAKPSGVCVRAHTHSVYSASIYIYCAIITIRMIWFIAFLLCGIFTHYFAIGVSHEWPAFVWPFPNQLDHSEHLTWTYTQHTHMHTNGKALRRNLERFLFLSFLSPLHLLTRWKQYQMRTVETLQPEPLTLQNRASMAWFYMSRC